MRGLFSQARLRASRALCGRRPPREHDDHLPSEKTAQTQTPFLLERRVLAGNLFSKGFEPFGVCEQLPLPPPPKPSVFPRVARGIRICQQKPEFLAVFDQYALCAVYKRGGASARPLAENVSQQQPPGSECAAPFVLLAHDRELGDLLDVFWLPAAARHASDEAGGDRAQEEDSGGGSGKDAEGLDSTEAAAHAFVSLQRSALVLWSLPLLRYASVTEQKGADAAPEMVRSASGLASAAAQGLVLASRRNAAVGSVRVVG